MAAAVVAQVDRPVLVGHLAVAQVVFLLIMAVQQLKVRQVEHL